MQSPFLRRVALLVLVLCVPLLAQIGRPASGAQGRRAAPPAGQPSAPPDSLVRHGDYLAHHVAMCVQCHSPRDEHGAIISGQEFRGASIPVMPRGARIGSDWAPQAPALAGLPGFEVEDGIRLLMTGVSREGRTPRRPMPPFRMARGDAEAVVTYLKAFR